MGFFSALKRVGQAIASGVRSIVAAVVKVGKAVVQAVVVIGKAALSLARKGAQAVGRALESVGRMIQGKQSVALERICRLLQELAHRIAVLSARMEVGDFHAWARLIVLEELLPTVIAQVDQAKSESDVSDDVKLLAYAGAALLNDPASVSDEAFQAVENLCDLHLHRSVDQIAMERLIVLFEGNREETEARVASLEDGALHQRQRLTEEELWVSLGRGEPGLADTLRGQLARFEEDIGRAAERLQDLELVSWTAEGLLQSVVDPDIRDLFGPQLDVIESIVFDFFRSGDDALLTPEQRERLREAAVIFSGDAIRRGGTLHEEPWTQV